jgi:hypothetical protein
MAANYVEPLLNHPTDPFLQEQMEEQRRYTEAREQRRRGENITDWANKTKIDREYNRNVLEDRRQYDEGLAQQRYDTSRVDAQADIEDTRRYDRRTARRTTRDRDTASAELGEELPKIRDRLDMLNQEETRIKDSLLVQVPAEYHTREAMDATTAFNRRAVMHLRQTGTRQGYVVPALPQGQGSILASTYATMSWLSSLQQSDPALGQTLLDDYQGLVDKEKQGLASSSARLISLNTSRGQLLKRQETILQRVGGGDVDYDAYDTGIGPDPNAQQVDYTNLSAITDREGAADQFKASDTGYRGLDVASDAQATYAQSAGNRETAYSDVETMYDQTGNFWNADFNRNQSNPIVEKAFERILNAPASSPQEKIQQLKNELAEITRREAALTSTFKTDYTEASQDTWKVPNLFGTPMDPTVDQEVEQHESQMGAFDALRQRIKGKIDEMEQQPQMVGNGTLGPVNTPDLTAPPVTAVPGLPAPPPPPTGAPPPPPANTGGGGSQPHLW